MLFADLPPDFGSPNRWRSATIANYFRARASSIRQGAKKRGLSFSLTHEDLIALWESQDGRCAITGVPMTWKVGQGRLPTAVSVDRVDGERGYEPGNIRLVCNAVNIMRGQFSDCKLRDWAKLISESLNESCPPALPITG